MAMLRHDLATVMEVIFNVPYLKNMAFLKSVLETKKIIQQLALGLKHFHPTFRPRELYPKNMGHQLDQVCLKSMVHPISDLKFLKNMAYLV